MFYGCAWLKVPKESTTISVSCARKFASLGQKMSNMVAERRLMEARDDDRGSRDGSGEELWDGFVG